MYGTHLNDSQRIILALQNDNSTLFWLAIFPFIFSMLIFANPLMRLPNNLKENRERREQTLHKALLNTIFDNNSNATVRISRDSAFSFLNITLNKQKLTPTSQEEFQETLNTICDELNNERDTSAIEPTYVFRDMDSRLKQAGMQRKKHALNQQSLSHVIFSSDNSEQDEIDQNDMQNELDDFDRALQSDMPVDSYSSDSRHDTNRNSSYINYSGR